MPDAGASAVTAQAHAESRAADKAFIGSSCDLRIPLLELEQFPRRAAEDFLLVGGTKAKLVDQVEAALLQCDQLRGIGAEDHAVRADGLNRAFDCRSVIGDRIEINPAQIVAWLARDVD